MENLIDLIFNGEMIKAMEQGSDRMKVIAEKRLEAYRLKVISEAFCKRTLEEAKETKNTKEMLSVPQTKNLMFNTAMKFGFKHAGSSKTVSGHEHVFSHLNGKDQLSVHTTKAETFWSHNTNGKKHVGSGSNHKDLSTHLANIFPAQAASTRKLQVEKLKEKYGINLMEAWGDESHPREKEVVANPSSAARYKGQAKSSAKNIRPSREDDPQRAAALTPGRQAINPGTKIKEFPKPDGSKRLLALKGPQEEPKTINTAGKHMGGISHGPQSQMANPGGHEHLTNRGWKLSGTQGHENSYTHETLHGTVKLNRASGAFSHQDEKGFTHRGPASNLPGHLDTIQPRKEAPASQSAPVSAAPKAKPSVPVVGRNGEGRGLGHRQLQMPDAVGVPHGVSRDIHTHMVDHGWKLNQAKSTAAQLHYDHPTHGDMKVDTAEKIAIHKDTHYGDFKQHVTNLHKGIKSEPTPFTKPKGENIKDRTGTVPIDMSKHTEKKTPGSLYKNQTPSSEPKVKPVGGGPLKAPIKKV